MLEPCWVGLIIHTLFRKVWELDLHDSWGFLWCFLIYPFDSPLNHIILALYLFDKMLYDYFFRIYMCFGCLWSLYISLLLFLVDSFYFMLNYVDLCKFYSHVKTMEYLCDMLGFASIDNFWWHEHVTSTMGTSVFSWNILFGLIHVFWYYSSYPVLPVIDISVLDSLWVRTLDIVKIAYLYSNYLFYITMVLHIGFRHSNLIYTPKWDWTLRLLGTLPAGHINRRRGYILAMDVGVQGVQIPFTCKWFFGHFSFRWVMLVREGC